MSHMLYDVILDVIKDRQGHFRSNSILSEKIEISCSRYRPVVPQILRAGNRWPKTFYGGKYLAQ